MEHIPLPTIPPRTPSPQSRQVAFSSTGRARAEHHVAANSPQTPQSTSSRIERLQDTPITPPNVYEEGLDGNVAASLTEAGRKSQQLQYRINDQSDFVKEGHILLFQSRRPFDDLVMGKPVGIGQWSRVCKVWERSSNSSSKIGHCYAAKVPSSKFAMKIIRHEAQILTHLSSTEHYAKYLVNFHGYHLHHHALVLEYLGEPFGLTLGDAIAMSVRKPMAIARDLIHGLAFIHGASVIHGDIKPGNIFVRCTPPLRLVKGSNGDEPSQKSSGPVEYQAVYNDFSAARFDSPYSHPTDSAATFDYMAPELFSSAFQASYPTTASDVYALGVTLMVAVAGTSPYESAPNPIARRAMAMQATPLQFMSHQINSEKRLESAGIMPLLAMAVAKDPNHRCNAELWKAFVDRECNDFATQECTIGRR